LLQSANRFARDASPLKPFDAAKCARGVIGLQSHFDFGITPFDQRLAERKQPICLTDQFFRGLQISPTGGCLPPREKSLRAIGESVSDKLREARTGQVLLKAMLSNDPARFIKPTLLKRFFRFAELKSPALKHGDAKPKGANKSLKNTMARAAAKPNLSPTYVSLGANQAAIRTANRKKGAQTIGLNPLELTRE
jgi:hypothetical protein